MDELILEGAREHNLEGSIWRFPGTAWSRLRACRGRARARLPTTRSIAKGSASQPPSSASPPGTMAVALPISGW